MGQVKKIAIKWASGGSKGQHKPDGPQPFGKLYPLSSSWSDIVTDVRAHIDAKLQKNIFGMRLMDRWHFHLFAVIIPDLVIPTVMTLNFVTRRRRQSSVICFLAEYLRSCGSM